MNVCKLLIVLAASIGSVSMNPLKHSDLLTEGDYAKEAAEQGGAPALSSGNTNPYWESFNKWQCFGADEADIQCVGINSGAERVIILSVIHDHKFLEFSSDPASIVECENLRARWAELLKNERSFCLYAALLQEDPGSASGIPGVERWQTWIASHLKTRSGDWDYQTDKSRRLEEE